MYKIATINTWKCDGLYFQRIKALKNQVQHLLPDILLFQEAFQSIDNRFNTAAYIAGELGYLHVSSMSRPKKRKIGYEIIESFSNVSILSRFPITGKYLVSLPSNHEDGGREAIYARISIEGKNLVVCSIHLSHLRNGAELRTNQLNSVLNQPFLNTNCDHIIIGGDFNFEITPEYLDKIALDTFLMEDTFIYNKDKTKPGYTLLKGQPCKIDHILQVWPKHKPKLIIEDSYIIFDEEDPETSTKASDHNGVMISFSIGNGQN